MASDMRSSRPDSPAAAARPGSAPLRVLVVEAAREFGTISALLPPAEVALARLAELGAPLLAQQRPQLVITPLIGPETDALEVAAHLSDLAWSGELWVLSGPLPAPNVVIRELRRAGPGLKIRLLPGRSA